MGIILGVGAGIAAYKSCELLRLLTESGHDVRVVPTPDALRFVGAATWAALSGQPVATTAWDDVHRVPPACRGSAAMLWSPPGPPADQAITGRMQSFCRSAGSMARHVITRVSGSRYEYVE